MVGIAILGYGVVGSGVYEVIRKNFDGITRRAGTKIDIKHILDIREFNSHPEKELFTKNYDDILTDTDVSVVVEVMGGVNPAYEFTKRALMAKKSVVTSNKELVAKHGCELLRLASENRVHYLFEASVRRYSHYKTAQTLSCGERNFRNHGNFERHDKLHFNTDDKQRRNYGKCA